MYAACDSRSACVAYQFGLGEASGLLLVQRGCTREMWLSGRSRLRFLHACFPWLLALLLAAGVGVPGLGVLALPGVGLFALV